MIYAVLGSVGFGLVGAVILLLRISGLKGQLRDADLAHFRTTNLLKLAETELAALGQIAGNRKTQLDAVNKARERDQATVKRLRGLLAEAGVDAGDLWDVSVGVHSVPGSNS